MTVNRIVLLAAGVLASLGLGAARAQTPAIDLFGALAVPRVTQEEMRFLHEAGAVLVVDVRSTGAYRIGHIAGAISVPLDEIAARAPDIARAAGGRRVVTYCSCPAEQTSIEAGRRLLQQGVRSVGALVGGFTRWVERGGPVEAGG